MDSRSLLDSFTAAVRRADDDLARTALAIARIEYRRLDPERYVARLDAMGDAAAVRIRGIPATSHHARIAALSDYVFAEQGFTGNRDRYDDPRNSFLNEVLDRRTGIPITLALIYIEVARRAGVVIHGVSFPGHFLLRYDAGTDPIILDPFDGGTQLSQSDCEALLQRTAGEDAAFDIGLLQPATSLQIVTRLLANLKRTYIRYFSFPQARRITDLLLALDPASTEELRDRGLLAYQLSDYASALTDLEAYLRQVTADDTDGDGAKHLQQIWDHVKALRRRIAGFN